MTLSRLNIRRVVGWCAIAAVLALALVLRVTELERKPMHTDEAVQAAKSGALFERGYYRYDPREFHGPTLYYFTLPVLKFFSSARDFAHTSEWEYRIVPALFGAGTLLWLLLLADGLGAGALGVSALCLALSPAGVYYSRYYIQETLLVFFSLGAIACGWRWLLADGLRGRRAWALAGGVCLGLMHATKETCVLSWAALGCGAWSVRGAFKQERWGTDALLALGAALVTSVLFFSSFLTNARGPLDSVLTYANYFSRAAGDDGQSKPFYYYAQLLLWNATPLGVWSEALVVVLAGVALWPGGRAMTDGRAVTDADLKELSLRRFFSGYTSALVLLYSALAYKTPWCVLSMLGGLCVLAGLGARRMFAAFDSRVWRWAVAMVLAAALLQLGWQAYRGAFKFPSDARNPYAYVHPTEDARRLGERIEALARAAPQGASTPVQVICAGADYWPLPWYVRRLTGVGFWSAPPADLDAPLIVAGAEFSAELKLELKGKYQINAYGLRPGVVVWLYVKEELWQNFLKERAGTAGR